jgi:hypothetical protein
LIKCIVLGGFTFPTPFLVIYYGADIAPQVNDVQNRWSFVIFLILSGAMLGAVFYYKDAGISALKDWFPSQRYNIFDRAIRPRIPDSQPGIDAYSGADDYRPTRNKRTSPSESPVSSRRSSNDHVV